MTGVISYDEFNSKREQRAPERDYSPDEVEKDLEECRRILYNGTTFLYNLGEKLH